MGAVADVAGPLANEARRTLPAPDAGIARVVGVLAATPWSPNAWLTRASELARAVGPRHVRHLLGAMVHPPPRAPEHPPWEWLFRVQVAAAFILGRVDDGWQGSARRRAFLSLIYGVVDWTTTAAIVAGTELARADESAAEGVRNELLGPNFKLWNTPIHYACIFEPLIACMPRLPNVDDEFRTTVREIREQMEALPVSSDDVQAELDVASRALPPD